MFMKKILTLLFEMVIYVSKSMDPELKLYKIRRLGPHSQVDRRLSIIDE